MNIAYDVYTILIALSVVILLSYFFNLIAKKTNVPSVLLLIITGIVAGQFIILPQEGLKLPLEILGTVGLIMIVLEASLDLHLTKDKMGLVGKALLMGFLQLMITSVGIAYIIQFIYDSSFTQALAYAITISIMSSAIIIPSVGNLLNLNKEFLIFEASFSDILGIMFFYFLMDSQTLDTPSIIAFHVTGNIMLTLIIAIILSYALILVFQRVEAEVKLFLPIAALSLLYAVGKMFHLSSLIFILAFGLILNNRHIFFQGKLTKLIDIDHYKSLLEDIRTLTLESSFVVRTFFFIVFGMSIDVTDLANTEAMMMALICIIVIYIIRFGLLSAVSRSQLKTGITMAPRGLITILLFYSIPQNLVISDFPSSILLLVIIVSCLIMMVGLIGGKKPSDEEKVEDEQEAVSQTNSSSEIKE